MSVDPATRHVLDNLAAGDVRSPMGVIAFVSGNPRSARHWAQHIRDGRTRFGARDGVSLLEDLPVNQALGLLLAWQRLRDRVRPGEGCLATFVFGEGTRATPFTEAEGGDKPAIRTFVRDPAGSFSATADVALRCFLQVERHLRRSGFDGLVVKWGDEIQIPSVDLAGTSPRLRGADVVRFVSVQPMTEETAAHKDWIGVDDDGRITGFIARRPLEAMRRLVGRGVTLRDGELYGGINLGSIAMSRELLDVLCDEFDAEIADPTADRRTRPDLDPQFFTALVLAAISDREARAVATQTTRSEVPSFAALDAHWPNLVERLHVRVDELERRRGRPLSLQALDLGRPFWGDVGQHHQMYQFVMGLRSAGPHGVITRALAGLPAEPDARGNWIVDAVVGPDVRVRNSVLVGVRIASGVIEGSVLAGTTAGEITAKDAFDLGSCAPSLELEPRAGTYRVIATEPVVVPAGERRTTVILRDGPVTLSVDESTDLRDRVANYDVPVGANVLSFRDAHRLAAELDPEEREARRERLRDAVRFS